MPHTVRQQTLDILVDSEAAALTLQAGISDLNRKHLLPVIDRVLDEFSVPDRRIRIARLQIDLGDLPLDDFAIAAEEALYPALRTALQNALRDAAHDGMPSETASRLELLEHYLSRGALPFWENSSTFSIEALLQQLTREDPAGLVGLIRRHAQDRRLLERLVLQLDDAALQRLLHLVTPEHAVLILAYMIDLHRIHRIEPLLSLHDTAFEQLLWILVLSYLLRDAGSQFNRRSFLRWLLKGLAESGSLDYVLLVETLRRGLQHMKRHRAPTSSLPAALDELLQELHDESITDATGSPVSDQAMPGAVALPVPDADARWPSLDRLLSGTLSSAPDLTDRTFDERLLRILQDHPDSLLDFLRSHRRDARLIAQLVDRLSEAALVRLLQLLEPEHAALIVAYLVDLRNVHRVTALVALDDRRFNRLLWVLVLSYVVSNPGSQFNRKSLVLSLLQGMAQSEGLELADLIETLRRGLAAIETHLAPAASLPAIIRELAGERAAAVRDERTPRQPAAPTFADFDGAEILRHILRSGRLPWDARPDVNINDRLGELARLPPETLRAIFAEAPVPVPLVVRTNLAQALPSAVLQALLVRLLPTAAEADTFRASLVQFAGQAIDRRSFYAGVLVALLAGDVIDFAQLAQAASGASDSDAASWPDFLAGTDASVLQALGVTPGTVDPVAGAAALRAVALQFLRGENWPYGVVADGQPLQWPAVSDDPLADAIVQMLEDDADGDLVRQLARDPRQRARWIRSLPGPALALLGQVIEPERHHVLLGAAEILMLALRQVAPYGASTADAQNQLWTMLFDFLAAHPGVDRSVEQFVADFLARGAAFGDDVAARWREQASELARAAGNSRLVAALLHDTATAPAIAIKAGPAAPVRHARAETPPARRAPPSSPLKMKTAFSLFDDHDRARGDPIYIGNAGLVLASPFLPHLFRELDLLDADDDKRPRLRDREAISRAVHLQQYLVDGRTDAPEPLLVLNKILCGVPTATPVARAIVMADDERRLCDFLLQSMLANWTALKGSSIAGLRETFLQREGRLQRVDDGWKLRVQRRTLDVLVDQVPWSISVLLSPWMPAPVHVTW